MYTAGDKPGLKVKRQECNKILLVFEIFIFENVRKDIKISSVAWDQRSDESYKILIRPDVPSIPL